MANPASNYPVGSNELDLVMCHIAFNVGATGAVGAIVAGTGREFDPTTPVTRNSAGDYTLLLREKWVAKRGFFADITHATFTNAVGDYVVEKINGNLVNSAGTWEFIVIPNNGTVTATDPDNGAIVSVTLCLQKTKQN